MYRSATVVTMPTVTVAGHGKQKGLALVPSSRLPYREETVEGHSHLVKRRSRVRRTTARAKEPPL
jgi:hypothetical protein